MTIRATVVCHHYGWTDIINTLSITNYLLPGYDKVYLLCHKPKEDFYRYYYRDISSVEICPFPTIDDDRSLIYFFFQNREKLNILDINFFGFYDMYRVDKYCNIFRGLGSGNSSLDDTALVNGRPNSSYYFVQKFYTVYDIPYQVRINSFFLNRNEEVEDSFFHNFVKDSSYTLIHDISDNPISLCHTVDNKIYQLNQSSNLFFDAVKVLEKAQEIHLIDSVWAAVCYLLDAKYNLLEHIPIYVYCLRGHQLMFTHPIKLKNWTIIDSVPRIIH